MKCRLDNVAGRKKGAMQRNKNLVVCAVGRGHVRGILRCCPAPPRLLCEEGCGQLLEGFLAILLTSGYLVFWLNWTTANDVAHLSKKK